jgi:hypothetical protein
MFLDGMGSWWAMRNGCVERVRIRECADFVLKITSCTILSVTVQCGDKIKQRLKMKSHGEKNGFSIKPWRLPTLFSAGGEVYVTCLLHV